MPSDGEKIVAASQTENPGDPTSAHNRFLFSHDGFHPTSTMHSVVASEVQTALRTSFPAKFGSSPEMTERELLVNVLGIPVSTGYDEFMAASGVPAALRAPDQDADGDSLGNIMEFFLFGNDPWSGHSPALPALSVDTGGAIPVCVFTWKPRYDSNVYADFVCQRSANMAEWSDVPAGQITANEEGTVTARVPNEGPGRIFLRLKVTVTP